MYNKIKYEGRQEMVAQGRKNFLRNALHTDLIIKRGIESIRSTCR
jgi:hypothetical protein